jgi:hypothetical protein
LSVIVAVYVVVLVGVAIGFKQVLQESPVVEVHEYV